MPAQVPINFDAPPTKLEEARRDGELGMRRAADRAERKAPGFGDRARAFAVEFLKKYGTASSESITNACKAAGITPESDDRAFGGVYFSLARRGYITYVGPCTRTRGHGTGGGRLYQWTGKELTDGRS
jgi:hypothetical protein